MTKLYYVHDPMCSWCWAFQPVWKALQAQLPANISVHYCLGGLAPDSNEPMPDKIQQFIISTWRRISHEVPNTEFNFNFNFDFWEKCQPRRSTYPACRAVLAATQQDAAFEALMVSAIQKAYYLEARNPSDDSTLCELAGEIGLDAERFEQDLNSENTQQILLDEIQFCRSIGANSFPSLILHNGEAYQAIQLNYLDAEPMLEQLIKAS